MANTPNINLPLIDGSATADVPRDVNALAVAVDTAVSAHTIDKSNPHDVSKTQVGLGNVDNVKQATKAEFDTHVSDNVKHITAAERTAWNSKETTTGAQAKADAAAVIGVAAASSVQSDLTAHKADYEQNAIKADGSVATIKTNLKNAILLTISNGAISVTQSYHSIDTESAATTDDLDTINGGAVGDVLFLRGLSSARKVTLKNGTGNIFTFDGSDIELSRGNLSIVTIIKMSTTQWVVSNNNYSGRRVMSLSAGTYDNLNLLNVDVVACDTSAGNIVVNSLMLPSTMPYHRVRFIKVFTANSISIKHGATGMNMADGHDLVLNPSDRYGFAELQANSGGWFGNVVADWGAKYARLDNNGNVIVNSVTIYSGTVNPEGAQAAPTGSLYLRTGTGELYLKKTGTGNTGWGKVTVA